MHSHEETKSVSSGGKEGEAKQTDRQSKKQKQIWLNGHAHLPSVPSDLPEQLLSLRTSQ